MSVRIPRLCHYTRQRSAWFFVREWLFVSSRERKRRLWSRSISSWNHEWSCISYLDRASTRHILSLTQWLGDSILRCSSALVGARTRNVLVEDWFMQACKDKDLGAWAAGSRDWWMTMEKLKHCVRWSACCGSPSSISLACFKQEEQTKLMYFPVQMATVLPLRTAWIEDIHSQAPLLDVQRQRWWNSDSGNGQRL